jgi:Putative beta-barrel porin 2
MKKVIASAGVLALGALSVQSVRADLTAGTDKPWSISGTLRGFYDDNYDTQPDGPARRGSYGIEVRPQATVAYSSGPTTINASYTYSDRYYISRPGDKNDQSHDFELTLLHSFNERFSVDALESFVDSQEPEVIDSSLSFPLRANGDNLRNSASINLHAQATKLLGFVVGYANTFYDYTAVTPGLNLPSYGTELNRFEHLATLDSRWTINEETVGIFGYQFGAVDYLGHGSLAPGGFPYVSPESRNDDSHSVYIGVEHSLRSDLSVSVHAGIQYVDYYNSPAGSNPSSLGPYVEASAQYTYMEGGLLTVGFRHSKNQTDVGYDAATGSLTEDQESSSVYGTIEQTLTPLSPKLVARLSAQYQNSRFNGGGYNNDTDVFYLVGLNFTYQFTHYLSAEAGYNYDLLKSDIPGRGYDRNRVYIGVTATY